MSFTTIWPSALFQLPVASSDLPLVSLRVEVPSAASIRTPVESFHVPTGPFTAPSGGHAIFVSQVPTKRGSICAFAGCGPGEVPGTIAGPGEMFAVFPDPPDGLAEDCGPGEV